MRKIIPIMACILLIFAGCAKKAAIKGPFDVETAFKEANRNIERKYYEEARRQLHKIKLYDTQMQYAPLAQLRIADSYALEDESDLAAEEYRRFLENYPRHKYASYAQYKIGMAYFEIIDHADRSYSLALKAIKAFETLMYEYPRNPYRQSAIAKIAKSREILAEYEYLVGEFYLKKKVYPSAITRFRGVIRNYPDYPRMEKVFYGMAVGLTGTGELQEAGSFLTRLRDEYPASRLIKKAEKAIAKIKSKRRKDNS